MRFTGTVGYGCLSLSRLLEAIGNPRQSLGGHGSRRRWKIALRRIQSQPVAPSKTRVRTDSRFRMVSSDLEASCGSYRTPEGQPHPVFQLPRRFKMLKSLANSDHRLKLPHTAVKLLVSKLKS